MNKTIFRFLIVILLLLLIISLLDTFVLEQNYPESSYSYLEWFFALPRTTLEAVLPYIGLVMFAVAIISAIGMFFFNNISRHIFTISVITTIILDSVFAISLGVPQLFTLIPIVISGIGSYIAGIVIALSYWSNISVYFNKKT